jgi:hypothetical protein
MYQAMKTLRDTIGLMRSGADAFNTASGSLSGIGTAVTSVNAIIDQIKSADDMLGGFLKNLKYPNQYGSMVIYIFYGVLIGFSLFGIIGALLTACCDKFGCRHLMYFSCIFLFIFGIIGFMIAVIFSIMAPIMAWSCDYIDFTLQSQANLDSIFLII